MKPSLFHRLSSILWVVIVSFIVLLAIYVSVGRMLASLTSVYQQSILQEINHRVPFLVEARTVSAEWHSFTPVLVLQDLRLTLPGENKRPLELAGGRLALDVAGSLRNWTLQVTRLHLDGLNLSGELTEDRQLRINGFGGGDTPMDQWAEHLILNVERVALDNVRLDLQLPEGEQRGFDLDLELSRDGSRRWLEARLSSTRGLQVHALARGVGSLFNLDTFSGRLYLDVTADDVGAMTGLAGDLMPDLQLSGAVAMELWASWDRGEPSADARFELRDMLLGATDESWQVPLELVAFEASLVERKSRWSLSVAALEIVQGEERVEVPRLQVDARSATWRLRAVDVPLAPLGFIIGDMDSLPPAAAEVIRVLRPRGTLSALELNVTDVNTPLSGWELQGNFSDVAVDTWHGAPGVTGASGHVALEPGGGFVVLDSRQFSMDFPTVYEAPLNYQDFHGTINIAWDDEAVRLSSDLVQASGDEGAVPVLFGLSIPLVKTVAGLEMDLLVGLQDLPARHRVKYIPFILNEGLRGWLASSIGEGRIKEGGFLWRGSLQSGMQALRTVQLFFSIEHTVLDYHQDWPALADVDGTVLIDDSDVSVWASSARLLDSRVSDLGVEVWMDSANELRLAVAGSIEGPAADGLAVVNRSPLGQLAGGVFADWRLAGQLGTELKLQLNLSDTGSAPQVEVAARFVEVDLDIVPGNLSLRGIGGVLNYSTGEGFSADDLSGQFWGRPLTATVGQQPAPASAIVIDIASTLEMNAVRKWLDQDWLALAQGKTAVSAQVVVAPGEPTVVKIDTALAGVALDLPAPLGKPAQEERQLQLALTLVEEGIVLDLDLEDSLLSRLELVEGKLSSGALAVGTELPAGSPDTMRIAGQLERIDVDDWLGFFDDYLRVEPREGVDPPAALPLAVDVEKLQVGQLVLKGTELGSYIFSVSGEGDHWQLAGESDWLRAQWLPPAEAGQVPRLVIQELDLAGLESLELDVAATDSIEIVELPAMKVTVDSLRRVDEVLGRLSFDLYSDGAVLSADNIVGELAGMQITAADPGSFSWNQAGAGDSAVVVNLRFGNLGETLQQLGYQQILETEKGRFDVVLEWPGGPQDFSLEATRGSVRVDIREGNFPDAPGGASGTLRVVSILNLAEIVQQLSLSHMFESGIPFNTIEGEINLHAGTLEVAKMDVQGGGSSFQFSGVSDVVQRTLDGELVVTLPVADNLPWVAALAAGLPVAAGVFVLSKLFESQVNRLTSVVYTTTGSWDSPVVEFDRIFDDASDTPTAAGITEPRAARVTPGQSVAP